MQNRLLLEEFEETVPAVLEPSALVDRIEGFPNILVMTFTKSIIEKWAAMPGSQKIAVTSGANGVIEVYKMEYLGQPVAFCMAEAGAPACVGELEELIAMGADTIVVFGSCGVLNREIADGHMIVPAAALRDEGTSFHYAPASEEIAMDQVSVEVLEAALRDFGYDYAVGKTWTTDAIYRETREKAERRKKSGCITVEMECSALIALCRFRKVRFAQFLYAADNLDAPEWEKRGLNRHQGLHKSDIYLEVAVEAGVRLKNRSMKPQEKPQ